MMFHLLLLGCFIGSAHSLVDFTNSAVYDIFDFRPVKETHIPISKCDSGCLIFAATMGEHYVQYPPDNLDPYALNILVVDNDKGTNISIAHLAQQRDAKQRKIPWTITGKGTISVINQNDPVNDYSAGDIVLYVVQKSIADQISYEVYDVIYVTGTTISPQSDIVTIMGTYGIGIQADTSTQSNSVTARLVGFDNVLDNNKDDCLYAYKTPNNPSFPGLDIQTKPPIISLAVGKKNVLQFNILHYLIPNSILDMSYAGFFATPGWNGCAKAKNGGIQTYRTRDDIPDGYYTISNGDNNFNMTIDVQPNFDAKHQLLIYSSRIDQHPTLITGTGNWHLEFSNTNYINIFFESMKGDQGFFLRYSSTLIQKPTTTGPNNEASSTVTSIITAPTTSSGWAASGCALSMLLISLHL